MVTSVFVETAPRRVTGRGLARPRTRGRTVGTYQRTCEVCGAEFVAHWPRRRRCSTKCSQQRVRRDAPEPEPVAGARWVALTKGMFALVDETDFVDVSRWNWCVMECVGLWYAMRGRTPEEVLSSGKKAPVLLHRYLLHEPFEEVDHRNGDGLDNRRENLRASTHAQNMMNSPSRVGSSRFKGVSLSRGRWRATIRDDYRTVHLGRFDTEKEAAHAYDEAARRLHGSEFARVNFPRGGERSALHE